MTKLLLTAALLLLAGPGFAQMAGDSIPSPLKTMSYKQYKAYLDGEDFDHLSLVADINHYPSAEKVLGLKKELGLTPDQLFKITTINTELIRKKKEMGRFMIKNERALDSMFRIKKIDDGSLTFLTTRTGLYLGEWRNAILQTYLKVDAILTPAQKKKYQQLAKP